MQLSSTSESASGKVGNKQFRKMTELEMWKIIGRPLSVSLVPQRVQIPQRFLNIAVTAAFTDLSFLNLHEPSQRDPFADVVTTLNMTEDYYYKMMCDSKPNWIGTCQSGGGQTAKTMYAGTSGRGWSNIYLNGDCKPKLKCIKLQAGVPAFNGEGKSILEEPFEEAAHYISWGVAASYFEGDKPIYYDVPPRGFAIISHNCPVAYIVMIEMIGCNYMSFITKPFYLGTHDHIESIQLIEYFQAQMLPSVGSGTDYSALAQSTDWFVSNSTRPGIRYTKLPFRGKFIKFIAANAFAEEDERSLKHPVTEKGQELLKELGELYAYENNWSLTATIFYHLFKIYQYYLPKCNHSSLVKYTMKFGFFDVAIESDFVVGRFVRIEELRHDEGVITQICECLKELGKHQLLYIDLRPPNILIESNPFTREEYLPKRVRIVDYDDCLITPNPLCCGHAVFVALKQNDHVMNYILTFPKKIHGLNKILKRLAADVCVVCAGSTSME